MCIYIYIYICIHYIQPAAYRRLPDGVGTNGVFTEGPQIAYILSCLALNAHVLPHVVSHVATS